MSVPLWVEEVADQFWAAAGMTPGAGPFPRDLRRAVTLALPLAVVYLPHLGVDRVRAWLRQNGIACPCDERDRPLRACLVARAGFGFALIDGTDAEDEQRFSLAHEVAHFLRHYDVPRRKASRKLGEQVIEVFDGLRPPSLGETFRSLLAGLPLGFHLHLMSRDGEGAGAAVDAAEEEADRLAFELLAPAASVLSATGDRAALVRRLCETYGLPVAQARTCAGVLMPSAPVDPLLARLGIGT